MAKVIDGELIIFDEGKAEVCGECLVIKKGAEDGNRSIDSERKESD